MTEFARRLPRKPWRGEFSPSHAPTAPIESKSLCESLRTMQLKRADDGVSGHRALFEPRTLYSGAVCERPQFQLRNNDSGMRGKCAIFRLKLNPEERDRTELAGLARGSRNRRKQPSPRPCTNALNSVRSAACGFRPARAYRPYRRRGRVAEGGGLLNRYRLVKAYRGFESLRLRHASPFGLRVAQPRKDRRAKRVRRSRA